VARGQQHISKDPIFDYQTFVRTATTVGPCWSDESESRVDRTCARHFGDKLYHQVKHVGATVTARPSRRSLR